MTKQQEIREGIKEWVLEIRQYLCNTEFAPEPFKEPVDADVLTKGFPKKLIKFLDDNGVVLKVEKPLPPLISRQIYDEKEIDIAIKQAALMVEAGYVATKSLIEEE